MVARGGVLPPDLGASYTAVLTSESLSTLSNCILCYRTMHLHQI